MKKFITTSLFIFTAIVAGVAIVGLVSNNPVSENIPKISNTNLVLSMTELAKHNSAQSCWLLISGKIYDVTSYLNSHPGGEAEILKSCGADATAAYDTKDNRGRPHSNNANAMLADYFIGNLNQTVTTPSTSSGQANPTTPPVANPNPTIPLNSNNREFDD